MVDDDEVVASTLSDVLRREGLETDAATSLSEARARVQAKHFDAVLVDLLLGGEDGLQLLTTLRREEEARRQAAERAFLETAIHQIPAGVAIVEAPSFRVLLENERVFQLARVPTPKIGERLEHSVFQGYNTHGRRLGEEEWPLVRAIRAGETVVGEEIELRLDDSARVTLQISAAPVRGPSGEIIAGVVTMVDATPRKRSERRQAVLANLSDELAAAQLERSEVLAIVCRAAAAAVGEHASIHLVDPDGVTLRAAAVHDPIATRRTDRERILGAFPLRAGEGRTGRVVATGEPLFLPAVDVSLLRAHIFDRFYQAHATSHLSGLGLGLFISRQIVELHRGTIQATFPERGGTRIEVTLPIYSTTDE